MLVPVNLKSQGVLGGKKHSVEPFFINPSSWMLMQLFLLCRNICPGFSLVYSVLTNRPRLRLPNSHPVPVPASEGGATAPRWRVSLWEDWDLAGA